MIVEGSAILAILQDEPETEAFYAALQRADVCRMSARTYLELCLVVDRQQSPLSSRRMDDLLTLFRVTIEPVTVQQVRSARAACRDYGKGMHPTGLNYGDLFAYVLARERGEPLLFKGGDLMQTDLMPAIDA